MEEARGAPGRPPMSVDRGRCSACGRCVAVCPHRILAADREGYPAIDPAGVSFCLRCGHCVAACGTGALAHRDLAPDGFAPQPPWPAPETALAWLRSRRSVRSFDPRPVDRETLRRVLEAARHAPTGHNAREVGCVAVVTPGRRERLGEDVVAFYRRLFHLIRFPLGRAVVGTVVGRTRFAELRAAVPGLRRAQERLRRGEDPLFHHAPAILLFHAPPAETAEVDCALAAGQVTLLAPSLGLGTCHVGYASAVLKRRPGLAGRFGVDRGRRVYAVLAVGYPALTLTRWVPRPPLPLRFR